ncbi:MAG: cysteine hydrolase family protein [Gemmatimonadales bacterium]
MSEESRKPRPPALLLVDVQQGLDDPRYGERNNPDAERRIAELLEAWRRAAWPVLHVRHLSLRPDSPLRAELPGNAFKPEAEPKPGEPIFPKHANDAFVGTGLESHLRAARIESLVIAGLTTDHCVSSTARSAANLGFEVTVAEDATATHERTGPDGARIDAERMHRVSLASLHGEFATVRRTAELLAALGLAAGETA